MSILAVMKRTCILCANQVNTYTSLRVVVQDQDAEQPREGNDVKVEDAEQS